MRKRPDPTLTAAEGDQAEMASENALARPQTSIAHTR